MKDESRFLDDSLTALEDSTLHRSITPTTKHPPSNMGTWRSSSNGPLADLPPPAHLLQPIHPPEVTEGSTPIIVRKLMNLSNGGEAPGVVVKKVESAPTGKVELVKNEEMFAMPPQRKQVGVVEVKTTDVISDMQKLRLRLEEECKKELADMDRQFQTRMYHIPEPSNARPGSAPSQRKDLQVGAVVGPSHSRVSSDSSEQSGPSAGVNHRRDYSLPVNLESQTPSYTLTVPAGAPHTSPQQASSSRHFAGQVLSAERAIAVAAGNKNNNNKGFSTPPPVRSPPYQQPVVFQSFRQNNHAPREQFARTSSGNTPGSGTQGLTQSYDFSSTDVTIQVGGTHYSTLVVKGRKKGHAPHSVSTDGAGSTEQQQFGLSASGESPFYDRLGPHLVDQPEQKAVPLQLGNVQSSQQQQQQQQSQLKLTPQQQPAYVPARSSTFQGTQRSQSKLETRNNVPLTQVPLPPPGAPNGGAVVHMEAIPPYMSSQDAKVEMKKYVPFADKKRKSSDSTSIPDQTWC